MNEFERVRYFSLNFYLGNKNAYLSLEMYIPACRSHRSSLNLDWSCLFLYFLNARLATNFFIQFDNPMYHQMIFEIICPNNIHHHHAIFFPIFCLCVRILRGFVYQKMSMHHTTTVHSYGFIEIVESYTKNCSDFFSCLEKSLSYPF